MDNRYSRQIALPGFGAAAQDKLQSARVLVIGAGGLGSTVIPSLAGAGVGTIGIIDKDRVEESNLHRQHIHGVHDIGRSKTVSAIEAVAELNPSTRVVAREDRLTAANALTIFAEYDLVMDGSDNFVTRYLANDAAELTGIPVVWGSVSQYGGQASVSWGQRGPTYRDLFPVAAPPGAVASCALGGVLPTTVGVIGSIMASEAIKILTGLGTPLLGRVTLYDALTGEFRELEYSKDPAGLAITRLIDYEAFCGLDTVSPRDLASRTDEFTLLDVREPWEAQIASLPGSIQIPLGILSLNLEVLDTQLPVVVYCHHGVRSASARQLLAEHGFAASHLDGGIDAWSRDVDATLARY
jgi:molybdopterin/thiamine biosynthesis adenylyltransferase/rhodanese-related sulfurtransferase